MNNIANLQLVLSLKIRLWQVHLYFNMETLTANCCAPAPIDFSLALSASTIKSPLTTILYSNIKTKEINTIWLFCCHCWRLSHWTCFGSPSDKCSLEVVHIKKRWSGTVFNAINKNQNNIASNDPHPKLATTNNTIHLVAFRIAIWRNSSADWNLWGEQTIM